MLAPGDVHHHAPLAVDALQDFVVLALQSGLADQVALGVTGEIGRVQLGFADFADISDHMRGQAILRIQPARLLHHFQFRERARVAMRIDEGQLGRRDVALDGDGTVALSGRVALYGGLQIVQIQVQAFGDGGQMLQLEIFLA